jgi:hypothetical protein
MQNAQTRKEVSLHFFIMESIFNLNFLCTYTHLADPFHGKDFAKLRRGERCLIEFPRVRERVSSSQAGPEI